MNCISSLLLWNLRSLDYMNNKFVIYMWMMIIIELFFSTFVKNYIYYGLDSISRKFYMPFSNYLHTKKYIYFVTVTILHLCLKEEKKFTMISSYYANKTWTLALKKALLQLNFFKPNYSRVWFSQKHSI